MQNLIIRNDLYNQIKYRENVVRGTVTAVNNNGTYDVRFKCESTSYPNVPTYAKNSNLQIGDRVTVLFEGRNREMPKILAFADNYSEEDNRVKHSDWDISAAITGIYVVYKKSSDNKFYLVTVNSNNTISAIAELPELATGNNAKLIRIITDSGGNIYAQKQNQNGSYTFNMYKYNSSGVFQTSTALAYNEMFGFISNDGYLYTMVYNERRVYKRSLSTLGIIFRESMTEGHRYLYLCFDGDGYIYTYDRDYPEEAAWVKWEIGTGVSEFHKQGLSELSGWADLALLGNNIVHDYYGAGKAGIINKDLNSDMTSWGMNDIPDGQVCGVASDGTYWYILGENTADNKLIVEKYNSSKVLQSTIDISTDYISGSTRRYYHAITAYPF